VRIRNTEVKFSFLLFVSLAFLYRDNSIIPQFFSVCLIHELGHAVAISLTGGRIEKIVLSGYGISIIPKRSVISTKSSVLVILSGPLVNILIFLLSLLKFVPHTFGVLNLASGIYNLLPYRCLDGGTLIYTLFSGTVHEYNTMCIVTAVQIIISFCVLTATVLFGTEFIPVLIVSLILFVSDRKK